MGTIDVRNVVTDYNVNRFGVFPYPSQPSIAQNATDNTARIQEALNAAESQGGGIVYFPPGTYVINSHLSLPNKVYMIGIGGTTFGINTKGIDRASATTFLTQAVSILSLANNSNDTMVVQKGDPSPANNTNFYQAGIENFVIYGNKDNQTSGHGIYINDATDPTRGHCRFRNILLLDIRQVGFYGGIGQHELYLDEVVAYRCGADGIYIRGEDCKLNRVQSASNTSGAGIKITGGGATRLQDIDVWGNNIGIDIYDVMNIDFYRLESNINTLYGVYIHPGGSVLPGNWSPAQIQIFRGIFDSNGVYDIYVSANSTIQYGASDLTFVACQFRGNGGASKPSYAIMDDSQYPSRNIVSDCYIQRSNYSTDSGANPTTALVNRNDIYMVRDCYDYDTRQVLNEFNIPYAFKSSSYSLAITECFLTVDASSGNKTITLPRLSRTQLGKVYFISKLAATVNSVTLAATSPDTMTGITTLNSQFSTLMVINAATSWYCKRF